MRKSTLVVALAASAALVAGSAGATFATSAAHSNRGGATLHQGTKIAPAKVGKMHPDVRFKQFNHPVAPYTNRSCDIDLSSISDGTVLSSVTGCSTTVTLSSSWGKVSVPNTWATWGSPPDTESATPNALWSSGQTSATVSFGKKVHVGGFEVEPDNFAVETIQVDFYRGPNGTGKFVGSISHDPNGQAGALLYGAKARHGFRSAVITDLAGGEFAIAQVRV